MTFAFKKATREHAKARIAIIGPAGSGKTFSLLAIATAYGGRIAVIDTERGSASKYAGRFEFDVLELDSFSPDTYVEAINAAVKAGYGWLIIDSLSHAWMGKDGALEQVDNATKRSQSANSFTAWRDITPKHNRLVDALVSCRCHLGVTMRSKTEYVLDEVQRGNKTVKVPRKVGLAPIQRDGLEYEFDVVGEMSIDHDWCISKTRCEAFDGQVISKPGQSFAEALKAWLETGAATKPASVPPPANPVMFGARYQVWGGRAVHEAPASVVLEYIQALEAVLKDDSKAKAHAKTAEHLREVEGVYEKLVAAEMDRAKADIGGQLDDALEQKRQGLDPNEGPNWVEGNEQQELPT